MLTNVTVISPGILESPLVSADDGSEETDFVQILNIDGLGPVAATVNTTQYGSVDGEFYNGSTTGKRNIVLTLRLNPDWAQQTFETLRQILYTYFLPELEVRLQFESTHLPDVEIIGYVESCEPDIFAPEELMTVSIICPDPFFYAIQGTAVQGETTDFTDATTFELDYEGNIAVGFILDISDGPDLDGELRLISQTPSVQLFTFTGQVNDTESIEISTVQGNKYARQVAIPGGAVTDSLGKVSTGSAWISLRRGKNIMQIQSATPGQNWTLRYNARYGGL